MMENFTPAWIFAVRTIICFIVLNGVVIYLDWFMMVVGVYDRIVNYFKKILTLKDKPQNSLGYTELALLRLHDFLMPKMYFILALLFSFCFIFFFTFTAEAFQFHFRIGYIESNPGEKYARLIIALILVFHITRIISKSITVKFAELLAVAERE